MANVTKPIILDETGQAIVEKLDAIAGAMTPPTAEDIATSAIPGIDNVEDALDFVNDKIDEQTAGVVKSVNAIHPDAQGEVRITNVAYSDNFTSDKTQNSEGEFIIRTAGGDASISDGDAFITRIYGNRVHTGYTPESLNMEVTMTPRIAPDPITAELDAETFEAYVEEAGEYDLIYTSDWSESPALYGVTVTGTPLDGDSIVITWDGESEPYMAVTAPRVAPDGIIATINRDTFVGYVSESGVTTLTYTNMWSANPALYGVTVSGTPISGDYITITYYKEQRGTIYVATPTAFKSTWWNLYNHTAGYAYLTKYSTEYGFRIGGTYTALQYSATLDGAKSSITPVDGVFTIPGDGYAWVTGGNNTNTYIINQWSDWTDGPAGEFEAYSESTINLATIMNTYFPYGLLRVGVQRDEINLNASVAISKIQRMAYTSENMAIAKASGRSYEYDNNYIYIIKESFDSYSITLDGSYIASDHGNEFFVGTSVPVYLETMYGNNLKNKLERDVVTVSQQSLTDSQQTQVRSNLNAASKDEIKPITITLTPVSNANGSYSNTTNNSLVSEDMKAVAIDVGTPETFNAPITITTGNGTVSLSCPNATGSSTVAVTLIRTQPIDVGTSYPSVTSTEFDILAGRIGSLGSLSTSVKTSAVDAINSIYDAEKTYMFSGTIENIQSSLATLGASMANGEIRKVQLAFSAAADIFAATTFYGTLARYNATRFAVMLFSAGSANFLGTGRYNAGTWTWKDMYADITSMGTITRMSHSSATTHTLMIPSGTYHFLFLGTNSSINYAVLFAVCGSTGNVVISNINVPDGVTITTATNALEVTVGTARALYCYALTLNGKDAPYFAS